MPSHGATIDAGRPMIESPSKNERYNSSLAVGRLGLDGGVVVGSSGFNLMGCW